MLGCIKKTVHFDKSQMRRMFLFVVVVFSKHQYGIFSNQTSVPNILPWLSGLGAQRIEEQRLIMHDAHK